MFTHTSSLRSSGIDIAQTYLDDDKSFDRRAPMLYYAIVFFVIALIAGALGFFGIAGAASSIAQILFFVFIVLFLASLIFGGIRRPPAG